jgi:hypothetical protein
MRAFLLFGPYVVGRAQFITDMRVLFRATVGAGREGPPQRAGVEEGEEESPRTLVIT